MSERDEIKLKLFNLLSSKIFYVISFSVPNFATDVLTNVQLTSLTTLLYNCFLLVKDSMDENNNLVIMLYELGLEV